MIPDSRSGAVVDLTGIARRFGVRWALRGVTLQVHAGEVIALMGHNGSGKTTLLRILSTALRPSHGRGRIFGHDLVREASLIRGDLGILGHSPGLYNDLTARENLLFAARMSGLGIDREEIESVLDRVSLRGEAEERVRGFSAGMQRRLALARLFLLRPRLILLDEPYSSLDAAGIDLINCYLLDHSNRGGSAVVATHDLTRGAGVLGRVVELDSGRLVVPAELG